MGFDVSGSCTTQNLDFYLNFVDYKMLGGRKNDTL